MRYILKTLIAIICLPLLLMAFLLAISRICYETVKMWSQEYYEHLSRYWNYVHAWFYYGNRK